MQGRGEAAQDKAELVEADRPKARRQDPMLIIDKTGIHAVVDGVAVRFDDGRGLRGRALQCLIADLERDDRPAVK
jgi:hypothetical protein